MNIRDYTNSVRTALDKLDAAFDDVETEIGKLSAARASGGTPSKRGRKPGSGARKSIVHPNEIDFKVLNAMLAVNSDEIRQNDIVEATGFSKPDIAKSIKWLNSVGKVKTNGRGRGTSYTCLVSNNDLQPVDPNQEQNFRKSGGPTVREITRAVFNSLEPLQKVKPAEITKIAQNMFPDQNLQRSSFGTIFGKMAEDGEIQQEGEGRGRWYWRGPNRIEGAAEASSDSNTTVVGSEDQQATG